MPQEEVYINALYQVGTVNSVMPTRATITGILRIRTGEVPRRAFLSRAIFSLINQWRRRLSLRSRTSPNRRAAFEPGRVEPIEKNPVKTAEAEFYLNL
jgi:hypothetical protein